MDGPVCRLLVLSPPAPWVPPDGHVLGDYRLQVDRVERIHEAGPLAEQTPWDVVVFRTDQFPSTDPAEVLDVLRGFAREATFLPVSPRPDAHEAVYYLKHGAFEYLEEPLSRDDFFRALAEAIENREAFREILELNETLEAQRNELLREKAELERRNRELEAVSELARALAGALEPNEVVEELGRNLARAFPDRRPWIGILDRSLGHEQVHCMEPGDPAGQTLQDPHPPPWMHQLYHERKPLEVERPDTDLLVRDSSLARLHRGAFVKVPLVARSRTIGSLTLEARCDGSRISPEECALLGIFADTAAIALENANLYQNMRELSLRDELTGLYNRRHLLRQLDAEWGHADRHGMPLSVLMLDIDHFKQLNDGNDHLTGDAALKRLAELLVRRTRGIDTVARYGGEEFVVILPRTDRKGTLTAAEKLRSVVAKTRFEGERAVPGGNLTVSIGGATYPEDGATPRELLERADQALYRAKEGGRNRVHLWEGIPAGRAADQAGG